MDQPPNKRCFSCGAEFTCDFEAGQDPCWCSREYPPALGLGRAGEGCLCRRCLEREIDRALRRAPPGG